MRVGWRRTGEKEGDVISPGMSLGSLQVGVKLGDERSDFNYVLTVLLSTALRNKSQNVVSLLERSLERMFLSRPNGSRISLPRWIPAGEIFQRTPGSRN